MSQVQISFDFEFEPDSPDIKRPSVTEIQDELAAQAEDDIARGNDRWRKTMVDARDYWRIGMVTSLPLFATVQDSEQRFTQMLPGVIESIAGDKAAVRIYASPAYGYTIDSYPLHMKLAIDVDLTALGVHHGNHDLERLVRDGLLAEGCQELAARVQKYVTSWRAA